MTNSLINGSTPTNAIYLPPTVSGGSYPGTTGMNSDEMEEQIELQQEQIQALLSDEMGGGGAMMPGMFDGMCPGGNSMCPGGSSGYGQIPGMSQIGGQPGNMENCPTVKLTDEGGKPLELEEAPDGHSLYNMQGKEVGELNSDDSVTFNSSAQPEIKQMEEGTSVRGFLSGHLGLPSWLGIGSGKEDGSGNVTFSNNVVTVSPGDVDPSSGSQSGVVAA